MSKIRHVMTFEGKLPNDEMEKAKVLGNPNVHAARDALLAALKEAGAEHTAVSKVHREGAKGPRGPKTAATVAPVQEPDMAQEIYGGESVAEEPRHGRRAAA